MAIENETPETRHAREQLQRIAAGVAQMVSRCLPADAGVGFAVVLFDFGDAGHIAYASNAEREGMTRALRELLEKVFVKSEVDALRRGGSDA